MRSNSGEPRRLPVESHAGPEIPMPDLSPFREGEFIRHVEHRFPFPGHEDELTGIVKYEMQSTTPRINVRISAVNRQNKQALAFNGVIRDTDVFARPNERMAPESGSDVYATIFTRLVEPPYRRRGLGETGLRLMEETFRRIGEARPESRPRWIQILTGLESTSSLVVDPNWLSDWLDQHYDSLRYDALNRLLARANNRSSNLGYVPAPGFEEAAVRILSNGALDAKDVPSGQKDVIFYKKLDPTVTFKPTDDFL